MAAWEDLRPRVISAAVMAGGGLAAVLWGGVAFLLLVAMACGLMAWELARIVDPPVRGKAWSAPVLGLVVAFAVLAGSALPLGAGVLIALLPMALGAVVLERGRFVFAAYGALVVMAGVALVAIREDFGLALVVWLILVVIASDVGGYFGGRALGGPKFMPRISPSKTWSGTISGWLCAALVGLVFGVIEGWPFMVRISIATAMAAQVGDLAESAIKRRNNVKDSSHLIPGHGGLLDRFDSLIGAAVFVFVLLAFGWM